MEIPAEALAAATTAIVATAAAALGAIKKLWSENSALQEKLRVCERTAGRALALARYEVEQMSGGPPSVAPPPVDDDEPTINRRVRLDRDKRWIEDRARVRAQTDEILQRFIDSDRPAAETVVKTRIRRED